MYEINEIKKRKNGYERLVTRKKDLSGIESEIQKSLMYGWTIIIRHISEEEDDVNGSR